MSPQRTVLSRFCRPALVCVAVLGGVVGLSIVGGGRGAEAPGRSLPRTVAVLPAGHVEQLFTRAMESSVSASASANISDWALVRARQHADAEITWEPRGPRVAVRTRVDVDAIDLADDEVFVEARLELQVPLRIQACGGGEEPGVALVAGFDRSIVDVEDVWIERMGAEEVDPFGPTQGAIDSALQAWWRAREPKTLTCLRSDPGDAEEGGEDVLDDEQPGFDPEDRLTLLSPDGDLAIEIIVSSRG